MLDQFNILLFHFEKLGQEQPFVNILFERRAGRSAIVPVFRAGPAANRQELTAFAPGIIGRDLVIPFPHQCLRGIDILFEDIT